MILFPPHGDTIMRPTLLLISAAVSGCLLLTSTSAACSPAAVCTAGVYEVAVVSPAIIITDVRVAILPRLGGCRLFSGVRARRAIRVDRRAVRRAVRGRLFRGRLLRGGCCG